jgi:hypothetical protein
MLVGGLALAFALLSQGGLGLFAGSNSGTPAPATPPAQRIPRIPDGNFGFGSATGSVTGAVSFSIALPIDVDKAYAKDGLAWIAFGAPGDLRAILVTFDEPENSVAMSTGSATVLGTGSQCTFDVTVANKQVSGRIVCPDADAYRGADLIGRVSIDVSFTAGS